MNLTQSVNLNRANRKKSLNVQVNQIISLAFLKQIRVKLTTIQYVKSLLLNVVRFFSEFNNVSFKLILNSTDLVKYYCLNLLKTLIEHTNVHSQILSKLISNCANIIVKIGSAVSQIFSGIYDTCFLDSICKPANYRGQFSGTEQH